MAHSNKVKRSVETPEGSLCVDLFERPGGGYGFELYRRDGEDPSGWYPIGGYKDLHFETEEAAWQAADRAVPWFRDQATNSG
ncbi:hypothetical protein EOI86_14385 [Hwanghaeella grinnelliae]|uniref:Uncharacterized protein n=1 Tax=Hwanghaeella grinnelliae TaxID=2500179 RepID=A0A437QPI8_9PROT|nr:hypothetical protein [Hwanghaeella grinnelliae]RVU36390.1 hypothetical protein EOI86_14385 [Hwanghaeella grinnelliae]